MKRLILGCDGSASSVQATRVAGRLAADPGAELVAVHVDQPPPLSWSPLPADPGDVEAAWKATDDLVRAQLAGALDPLGVRWTLELRGRAGRGSAVLRGQLTSWICLRNSSTVVSYGSS
jgi:nucleotide-binding universal stress UspA family protein